MSFGHVVYTTLSAHGAAHFACSRFEMPPPARARLVNRGFNDVYALDDRFLRLGRPNRRTLAEAEAEASALTELRQDGVPVATAVRGRDGRFAQSLRLEEGERAALLFDKAPGVEVEQTAAHAFAQGIALGRVHASRLSPSVTACLPRLDIDCLIDKTLACLAGPLLDIAEPMQRMQDVGDRLRAWLERHRPALSTGYCHGDCHGYNATIAGDEATLFDFDEGGVGWLAYDLGVYLWSCTSHMSETRRLLWPHFFAGYRSRKALAAADIEAIETMAAVREFWSIGAWAEGAPYWGDNWLRSPDAGRRIERLVERVDGLLSPRLLV